MLTSIEGSDRQGEGTTAGKAQGTEIGSVGRLTLRFVVGLQLTTLRSMKKLPTAVELAQAAAAVACAIVAAEQAANAANAANAAHAAHAAHAAAAANAAKYADEAAAQYERAKAGK